MLGVVLYGTSRTEEDPTIFAAVGTGYTQPLLPANTAAVATSPTLLLRVSSPCVGGRDHACMGYQGGLEEPVPTIA